MELFPYALSCNTSQHSALLWMPVCAPLSLTSGHQQKQALYRQCHGAGSVPFGDAVVLNAFIWLRFVMSVGATELSGALHVALHAWRRLADEEASAEHHGLPLRTTPQFPVQLVAYHASCVLVRGVVYCLGLRMWRG